MVVTFNVYKDTRVKNLFCFTYLHNNFRVRFHVPRKNINNTEFCVNWGKISLFSSPFICSFINKKNSRLTNRKINPNRTSLSHVDVRFEIRLSWTCACKVRILILFFWRVVIMTKLVSPRARSTSALNFLNQIKIW